MRLVLDARTAAFATLIDYAGVFPPASLTVDAAVSEYRAIKDGDTAWVAGRFLCRASQLTDLAAAATRTFTRGESPWEIGVIFDDSPGESAALAMDFHSEMDPAMKVAAAEARITVNSPDAIGALLDSMLSITPEVVPFVEVDQDADLAGQVHALADALESRRRIGGAKLRCGGVTPELFPSPSRVTEFILAATDARVPFKATAGLHQPIRHFDSELGLERHGFVNLMMAAALAFQGANKDTIEAVVSETNPSAFEMSAAFASWNKHRVAGSALRRMRQTGFIAYGSCDFDEPLEALGDLQFIGQGE